MSGVRFLSDLKCRNGTEPVVYMYFDGEGWFSLRQIADLFFPEETEEGLKLNLWCAKNIQGCAYYKTSLSNCVCARLNNQKILKILRSARIDVKWIVNIQSAQKILTVLDPYVRASVIITFNNALSEMLKKSGRKRAVSSKERMKIAAAQGWKCKSCPKSFDQDLTFEIDHVIEWSKGGSTRGINLQALCPNCHAKKSEQEKHRIFEDIRYG